MQNSISRKLQEMYDLLFNRFGPQHWWPGETDTEILIGAILTQNTNWKNVEKAISNLKQKDLISLSALKVLPVTTLAGEIRPAGYFNIKAKRIKNLADFIVDRYGPDLSVFLNREIGALKEDLLSVKGIGPETADSILLYAARLPVFVIDAYTYRILIRHDAIAEEAGYEELQAMFMDHLPHDTQLFNEFHALIVRTGKDYCRKDPRCNQCPLQAWDS